MTVGELMTLLERFDDDTEVRIMNQPSWPFELTIAGICSSEWLDHSPGKNDGDFGKWRDDDPDKPTVLYIVEGSQICYGSKEAWDNLERS